MSAPDELWINPADLENIDESIMVFTEPDKARADVRYIRAPESAPNGLADELAHWLHKWPGGAPNEAWAALSAMIASLNEARDAFAGQKCFIAALHEVHKKELAALRNQPGGAVPREPTVEMLVSGRKRCMADMLGAHMGPDIAAIWRTMYDAATKAGEGQTHAEDSDILAARGRK